MPRFEPLDRSRLPEFRDVIEAIDADHGYVPNSYLTQGRVPGLLKATGILTEAFWYSPTPSQPVRRLVGFAFSFFSGAMYSAAHIAEGAVQLGLPIEKIRAIAAYETSGLYTDEERALLALCRAAARAPGEVREGHLQALRPFFDDVTILRIVGLIAWTAHLNKWNDICATRLEAKPREHAERELASIGWTIRCHR